MIKIRSVGYAAMIGALILCSLGSGGCRHQNAQLTAGQADYRAGNYAQAYRRARAVADSPAETQENREAAAYLAGMAAYRNRDHVAAQQYLQIAADSKNPTLSADAKASLGLVYTDRGLYHLASRSLLGAAEGMTGQDKANAQFYAGVAQQREGRWPQARTTLSMAMSGSQDQAFRRRVSDQLRITGYTLQTGAFEVEDNAQRAASSLARKAGDLKMSAPRVVPAVDPGTRRKQYLVWVGQFSSWPTALMARERLGITNAIVTPLTDAK